MGKTVSNQPAIEVPVDELAAVAKWTYRDEDRPHLQMVVFADDHYTATDGHRMVRVPCKTHGHRFGLTWRDIGIVVAAHQNWWRHAVKLDGRSRHLHLAVAWLPRVITAHFVLSVMVSVPWYEAKDFPLEFADAIVTKRERGKRGPAGYHVNPQYLADMAEVHKANTADIVAGPQDEGVRLVSWSDTKLEPLKFVNQRGVVFLIMPIRGPVPGVDTPPEAGK